MNLFEKVEEIKGLRQKAKELDAKIREDILNQFVNLRYQMQEIEVGYSEYYRMNPEKVKVYYPILDLVEGFSKSNDKFEREYANLIIHTYTLKNSEGEKIQIKETSTFTRFIYENDKVAIKVDDPCIVVVKIQYRINISELSYEFCREFTYQEMIEQVVDSKDMILTCKKIFLPTSQESYEKYIRALGKEEGISSLKDLVESSQNEIQITPTLIAKVSIGQEVKDMIVWYVSEKVAVRLYIPYTLTTITLQTKTIDGVSLGTQKFEYSEFNEEFKTELTLSEVFQLMEK